MDYQILISSIVIVFGWFTVNWLSANREFRNKRREVRIEYLVNAYRRIASTANRGEKTTEEQKYGIESAIEDIQLFGNAEQLQVLKKVITTGDNNFTVLLEELRVSLRKELDLEQVKDQLKFYRMKR